MTRIGLVGCGTWGGNYVATLCSIPEVEVRCVCDIKGESLQKIPKTYPDIKTVTDYHELLNDDLLDGVIIATPPETHYRIAADFLVHNKAVLVEKPCTLSYHEAVSLVKLAEIHNLILMVGHLMEYHQVVMKMQNDISQGLLGKWRYILLERSSLRKIQNNVSVHWDLAVHDLSMIRYLVNKDPQWVAAWGISCLQPGVYDLVLVTMEFPDGLFVQIRVNGMYPMKKREAVIAGAQMTMIFDDVKRNDKLQFITAKGAVTVAQFEENLPLTNQCRHFIDCIRTGAQPRSGPSDILWVMRAMDLVEQSLLKGGAKLYWDGKSDASVETGEL